MLTDLKFALRSLLKAPGFTVVVVLTLALGIGATTAIFSVVYATLLRPLSYPQAERIVILRQVDANGRQNVYFSGPNFEDIREGSVSFDALAEYMSWLTTVTGTREAMRMSVAMVSRQFFIAMGVQPVLGRGFTPEETRLNGAPVALVSHAYWKSTLGGTPDIAGKHVNFDRKVYSIVGVMPAGFRFPAESELWIPKEQFEQPSSRTAHTWYVVGRLKPGVALQQARSDVSRMARALKARFGEDTMMSDVAVLSLRDALVGNARTVLLFLLGAAGVLLMAACANTANLLLAKSASRQQELAVRVALGAGRRRLLSQFFTEACLLSLSGGVLGILLAYWSVNALLRLGQGYLPGVTDIPINLPILGFSIGISFVTAAGLSLLLGMRAGRQDFFKNLKQGAQRQTGSVRDVRLRTVLMITQVAIATLLLAGTGLLTRSLLRVMDVRPGYSTENVLTADIFLTVNDSLDFYYRKDGAVAERMRRAQSLDEIVRRVRAIPGVDSAGIVRDRPLANEMMSNGTFVLVDDGAEIKSLEDMARLWKNHDRAGFAWYQAASSGYFTSMQIPLKRGRLFDERDTADTPHAALISETLARQRWPKQDPLGRLIVFGGMDGDMRPLRVVGVVGDVRHQDLEVEPEPMIYVNSGQRAPTYFSLTMHTTSPPVELISTVRTTLRNIDANLVPRFHLLPQVVSASFGDRQLQLYLLGMFAGGALLLAVLGLYGVSSYMVAERTREIGVRMALGAQASDVLRLVIRQGAMAAVIGIGLGICAELSLTGVLRGMLYGVSAIDPLTMVSVCVLLSGLTVLACWIPARRATRVDPLLALRAE